MQLPRPFQDAKLFFAVGAVFGFFAALLGATPFTAAATSEPAAFNFGALVITPLMAGTALACLSVLRNLTRKD